MDLKGRTQLFTAADVVPGSKHENYTNQVVVISPKHMVENWKPQYQSCNFQLFYADGGFGCNPESMGNAVFGTFLADGERERMERYHLIGILKPELVEEYGIEVPVNE